MEMKNFAHYFCTVAVERLIELGADHFFLAPGSRSTPMVSAIVRNTKAEKFLGIDERSMGFSALGYGMRAQKAGVIVVTSGTAASNLYPAITEAFMSSVPMLLITADRPFELRDCGANQTIFQTNMFANHIVRSFDLAPVSSIIKLDALVAFFEQALRYAQGCKKGPVHVNMQLREPLANLRHENEPSWRSVSLPARVVKINQPLAITPSADLIDRLTGPGLIVVGALLPDRGQEKILSLAKRLGWPIFADISSNIRLDNNESIIQHYDIKLLNPAFLRDLEKCSTIIKFGSRIVSKRLWHFIEHRPSNVFCLSLDESLDRIDHTGRFEHVQVGDLPTFLAMLLDILPPKVARKTSLLDSRAIDLEVKNMLEHSNNNEAYFAARLISQISEPANLFLSSGMPIRDADQFAHKTNVPLNIFVNRGASGIDGIMSTAAGIATVDDKLNYVLIGDVAFLHDTNGLMQVKQSRAPLLIIVINNSGGGIFHFLPIAAELDVITPFLDTPHQVHIDLLCGAHDILHRKVVLAKDFDEALREFTHTRNTMVVEVMIDRSVNVKLHQDFYKKITQLVLSKNE